MRSFVLMLCFLTSLVFLQAESLECMDEPTCVDCLFSSSKCEWVVKESLCLNASSVSGEPNQLTTDPTSCRDARTCLLASLLPFVVLPCEALMVTATVVLAAQLLCLGLFLGTCVWLKKTLYGADGKRSHQKLGCGFCGCFLFAEDPTLLRAKRVCVPCRTTLVHLARAWVPFLLFVLSFLAWFAGYEIPVLTLALVSVLWMGWSTYRLITCYLQARSMRQSEQRADADSFPISNPFGFSSATASSSLTSSHDTDHPQHEDAEADDLALLSHPEHQPSQFQYQAAAAAAFSRCPGEVTLLDETPIFAFDRDFFLALGRCFGLVSIVQLLMILAWTFSLVYIGSPSLSWLPNNNNNNNGDLFGDNQDSFGVREAFFVTWTSIAWLLTGLVLFFAIAWQESQLTLKRVVVTDLRVVLIYQQLLAFDIQRSIWHTDIRGVVVSDQPIWHGWRVLCNVPLRRFDTHSWEQSVSDDWEGVVQLDGRPLTGIQVHGGDAQPGLFISHLRRMPDFARLLFQRRNRQQTQIGAPFTPQPLQPASSVVPTCSPQIFCFAMLKLAMLQIALVWVMLFVGLASILSNIQYIPMCSLTFCGFFFLTANQWTFPFHANSSALYSPFTDGHERLFDDHAGGEEPSGGILREDIDMGLKSHDEEGSDYETPPSHDSEQDE